MYIQAKQDPDKIVQNEIMLIWSRYIRRARRVFNKEFKGGGPFLSCDPTQTPSFKAYQPLIHNTYCIVMGMKLSNYNIAYAEKRGAPGAPRGPSNSNIRLCELSIFNFYTVHVRVILI